MAVGDAASAMGHVDQPPDGLVIDIGLPDADGRDLCQALRARGVEAPVLFLTARDAVTDRLAGFSAGGDDYVTKPFHFDEVVARLRALLRRSGADAATTVGALRLDPVAHSISGERRRGVADADRVPAAGGPRRPARARWCDGASSCARPGRRARSCTTTRSTSTWRACAASCARSRRPRRSRRRTASATDCDEALSHAPRPAHGARPARGAGGRGRAHGRLQRPPRSQPQRRCQQPRALAGDRGGRDGRVRGRPPARARGGRRRDRRPAGVGVRRQPRDRAPAGDARAAARRRRAGRLARTCSTTCPGATCASTPRP